MSEHTHADVKACAYTGCTNTLPANSPFENCEVCRILVAGNAVRLILDPLAPKTIERKSEVEYKLVTQMTGEEFFRYVTRLEEHYLAIQKIGKLYHVKSSAPKAAKSIQEQIDEARELQEPVIGRKKAKKDAEKKEKKEKARKQSREEKLQSLFGDKAKEIMGEADEGFDL